MKLAQEPLRRLLLHVGQGSPTPRARAELSRMLEQLGGPSAWRALPDLLAFLRRSGTYVEEVHRAVHRILEEIEPQTWPALEERVRSVLHWELSLWTQVEDQVLGSKARTLRSGFGSFGYNGYEREEALRRLSEFEDGTELPFLVLRLNDWVAPVRDLAKAEVLRRARADYAPHFVRYLPLIERLGALERADHSEVRDAVGELLRRAEAQPALLAALQAPSRYLRRSALRVLEEHQDLPWPEVFAALARDSDLSVRLWAVQQATRRLGPEEGRRWLRQFARDPHLAVRTAALRTWVRDHPAEGTLLLQEALFDAAGTVRNFARYHLTELRGEQDYAALYREALDDDSSGRRRAAMGGLGETGALADFELLLDELASRSSKHVQLGLEALARLSFERARPLLLEHLNDERSGVQKTALRLLAPSIGDDDCEALASLMDRRPAGSSPLPLVFLVRRLGLWPRLRLLLAFEVEPGDALAEILEQELIAWCAECEGALYAPKPLGREELAALLRDLERAEAWANIAALKPVLDLLEREQAD